MSLTMVAGTVVRDPALVREARTSNAGALTAEGRILVADADPSAHDALQAVLGPRGYELVHAYDGPGALERLQATYPDLVVLDVVLPGLTGWEICQTVRQASEIPILILSAQASVEDRIRGLELGADDYVAKPFSPLEVAVRIRAILRRVGGSRRHASVLRHPGLEVDGEQRRVRVGLSEVALTPKEFSLLWQLASEPGRTFSRSHLLEQVWGYDFGGEERTVDVHIKRLRQKIEPAGHPYRYIRTVWGVGYRFEVTPAAAGVGRITARKALSVAAGAEERAAGGLVAWR